MFCPDYVLFDCDGVLVDSEALTQIVLQGNLARYGLHLERSQLAGLFMGGTMKGVMITARARGADLPDHWLDEIYAELFAALEQSCEVVPGIPALLDHLDAAGIGYAVGSNGPMAKMEITLRRCDLWDRFAGRVFSAHDCAASKPAPDVYLKAAALAGVAPARCAVVEDSATGARAGVAAGMRCYGFATDETRAALAPICTDVFEDMKTLPRLWGLSSA